MNIKCLPTGPFQVNTWIVPLISNNVLVIDPAASSFTHDQNKITDYLSKNNLIPIFFIFTHGHFDHIAGSRILKDAYPQVPLIVHKDDFLMCGSQAKQVQKEALDFFGLEEFENDFLQNLPDADIQITNQKNLGQLKSFSDLELQKEMDSWEIIHTPGHTEGSICLYNKNKALLIAGDTVFYHSWGRTDLPGGSEAKIVKSLKKLYSELPGQTLVYPGHGEAAFELAENF